MTLPIPTEENEQVYLCHWLDLKGLKYTAIPNSTFSKSWSVKNRNTRMGVRRGFPDLIVLIPPERAVDGTGRFLAIELKRTKGGTISKEQREWIDAINGVRVPGLWAAVCAGADAAMEMVDSCMKGEKS